MRILFVASDRMEFPGLLRRATAVRPTDLAADWSRRALLNGNEALLVANGVGPVRAAAATEAGIAAYEPDAIVSTGFCGALSAGLGIADLITANRIVTGGQIYDAALSQRAIMRADSFHLIRRTYGTGEARTGIRRRNCGRNGSCGSGWRKPCAIRFRFIVFVL